MILRTVHSSKRMHKSGLKGVEVLREVKFKNKMSRTLHFKKVSKKKS